MHKRVDGEHFTSLVLHLGFRRRTFLVPLLLALQQVAPHRALIV